jgi:hypothetical protein
MIINRMILSPACVGPIDRRIEAGLAGEVRNRLLTVQAIARGQPRVGVSDPRKLHKSQAKSGRRPWSPL